MSTDYGIFRNFCARSGNLRPTLPVCNLFLGSETRGGSGFGGGCNLQGIALGGGSYLANLGESWVYFFFTLSGGMRKRGERAG